MLDFFDSKLYYLPEVNLDAQSTSATISVVVNAVESDEYKAFIQAILKPFSLGLDDYQLLFFEKELPSFTNLQKSYRQDALLLFGVDPAQLGFQIDQRLYAPFKILDTNILFVEPLDLFLTEKKKAETAATKVARPKARLLWETLKLFFNDRSA